MLSSLYRAGVVCILVFSTEKEKRVIKLLVDVGSTSPRNEHSDNERPHDEYIWWPNEKINHRARRRRRSKVVSQSLAEGFASLNETFIVAL